MSTTTEPERPSAMELWRQAGGGTPQYDRARYRQLLIEHGHLVPGEPSPLPCGWRPREPS